VASFDTQFQAVGCCFFVLVVLFLVVVVLFCLLFELKICNWLQKELLPQRNGCVHSIALVTRMTAQSMTVRSLQIVRLLSEAIKRCNEKKCVLLCYVS